MNLQVQPIPAGSLLVDCYSPFTAASIQRIASAVWNGRRVVGVARYADNMTLEERDLVLGAGLGLFTVGVARGDSMRTPSAGLGSRDGLAAVTRLRALGIPSGVTHALDVERIDVPIHAADIVAYTNAADAVISTQTECMFYEGWGVADELGAEGLYRRLTPRLYWASSPHSVPPAVRGFAMLQLVEDIELAGVRVDVDEARVDDLGGQAHWLIAA